MFGCYFSWRVRMCNEKMKEREADFFFGKNINFQTFLNTLQWLVGRYKVSKYDFLSKNDTLDSDFKQKIT